MVSLSVLIQLHRIFLSHTLCHSLSLKKKKKKRKLNYLSNFQLFVIPRLVANQAPLSMGFSRQEYWIGLPFPPLGDLPTPGIEPESFALQTGSLPSEPPRKLYLSLENRKAICAYVCGSKKGRNR